MPSASYIFLHYVCSAIAAFLASATYAAPVKSLSEHLKNGTELGALNPTPWAYLIGNCFGWVAYSFAIKNWFVFFGGAPGLIVSFWLNFGALKLQYMEELNRKRYGNEKNKGKKRTCEKGGDETDADDDVDEFHQEHETTSPQSTTMLSSWTRHEIKCISVISFWTLLLTFLILALPNISSMEEDEMRLTRERVIGFTVNINLCVFYAAPLSTIFNVLRTRNSESIHFRTMMMNTMNSLFWLAYSVATVDWFIIIPNSAGLTFGIIQLFLYMIFPSSKKKMKTSGDDKNDVENTLDKVMEEVQHSVHSSKSEKLSIVTTRS